ncbi:hypothetical protein L7F22_014976 [Adiantum nelumboides]|nr:hypothetical protein [Adiantum nelumboides]
MWPSRSCGPRRGDGARSPRCVERPVDGVRAAEWHTRHPVAGPRAPAGGRALRPVARNVRPIHPGVRPVYRGAGVLRRSGVPGGRERQPHGEHGAAAVVTGTDRHRPAEAAGDPVDQGQPDAAGAATGRGPGAEPEGEQLAGGVLGHPGTAVGDLQPQLAAVRSGAQRDRDRPLPGAPGDHLDRVVDEVPGQRDQVVRGERQPQVRQDVGVAGVGDGQGDVLLGGLPGLVREERGEDRVVDRGHDLRGGAAGAVERGGPGLRGVGGVAELDQGQDGLHPVAELVGLAGQRGDGVAGLVALAQHPGQLGAVAQGEHPRPRARGRPGVPAVDQQHPLPGQGGPVAQVRAQPAGEHGGDGGVHAEAGERPPRYGGVVGGVVTGQAEQPPGLGVDDDEPPVAVDDQQPLADGVQHRLVVGVGGGDVLGLQPQGLAAQPPGEQHGQARADQHRGHGGGEDARQPAQREVADPGLQHADRHHRGDPAVDEHRGDRADRGAQGAGVDLGGGATGQRRDDVALVGQADLGGVVVAVADALRGHDHHEAAVRGPADAFGHRLQPPGEGGEPAALADRRHDLGIRRQRQRGAGGEPPGGVVLQAGRAEDAERGEPADGACADLLAAGLVGVRLRGAVGGLVDLGVGGAATVRGLHVGLDQRRVVEHRGQPLTVELAVPAGDDQGGDDVADRVGQGPALGHHAVDADDQREADDDGLGGEELPAEGLQRRGQGDQTGAGDTGGALRRQHHQHGQRDLRADRQVLATGLDDEQRTQGQVDAGAVEVERVAGRDDHADGLLRRTGGLQLGEQARQHRLRRRRTDDDQQLVLDQPDHLEDVEPGQPGHRTEHDDDEHRAGAPEHGHQLEQVDQRPAAHLTDGVGHAAERGDRRGPHDQLDDAEDDLGDALDAADQTAAQGGVQRGDGAGGQDRQHQDLQHRVVDERAEEAVRQQRVLDERDDTGLLAAGGGLVGGLREVGRAGLAGESGARLEQVARDEPHRQRDDGHHQEVAQSPQREASGAGQVAQRGDADDDGAEDDRADDDLDHLDEGVGQPLGLLGEPGGEEAHQDAGDDADDDPEPELGVDLLLGPGGGGGPRPGRAVCVGGLGHVRPPRRVRWGNDGAGACRRRDPRRRIAPQSRPRGLPDRPRDQRVRGHRGRRRAGARRGAARHGAARPRRHRRLPGDPGALPGADPGHHRARRRRRAGAGTAQRRRRLPGQTGLDRGAGGPDRGGPASCHRRRGGRDGERRRRRRRPRPARGDRGRRRGRADPQGVRPARRARPPRGRGRGTRRAARTGVGHRRRLRRPHAGGARRVAAVEARCPRRRRHRPGRRLPAGALASRRARTQPAPAARTRDRRQGPGADQPRRRREAPPDHGHPQGRPRRDAGPDGHRRAGRRHRAGHEAARAPLARHQGLHRDRAPRAGHRHRRRRGHARRRARPGRCRRRRSPDRDGRADGRDHAGPQRGLRGQDRREARLPARPRRRDGRDPGPPGHRVRLRAARGAPRGAVVRPGRRRRLLLGHLRPRARPRPRRRAGLRRSPDRAASHPGRTVHPGARAHRRAARRRPGPVAGPRRGRRDGVPPRRPRRLRRHRRAVRQVAARGRDRGHLRRVRPGRRRAGPDGRPRRRRPPGRRARPGRLTPGPAAVARCAGSHPVRLGSRPCSGGVVWRRFRPAGAGASSPSACSTGCTGDTGS